MKRKKYIKSYRSRSSLTGETLKSGFYVLSKSLYFRECGIGYCKGPEHNYEMDFERSKSLFANIYQCFVPECNANSHTERVKLLEKNTFLNIATKGLPVINSDIENEKLKKHIKFFDKNNGIFFFKNMSFSKTHEKYYRKIKYNGVKLSETYKFFNDDDWKTVEYHNNFFFVEEKIFDHFTSDFDRLFKEPPDIGNIRESNKIELCVENICTYLGIYNRKERGKYGELYRTFYTYSREPKLVEFFKSKLLDYGITLSRKKQRLIDVESRYNHTKDFDSYLKSNSLI